MAKAMVCSEQHHILLLREWERCVLSRWISLFINIKDGDIKKLWILSSKFRQAAERLVLYQRLQCRDGPQLTQRLQEEFMLRDECSWKTFLPGSTHTKMQSHCSLLYLCSIILLSLQWRMRIAIKSTMIVSLCSSLPAVPVRQGNGWTRSILFLRVCELWNTALLEYITYVILCWMHLTWAKHHSDHIDVKRAVL